MKSRPK